MKRLHVQATEHQMKKVLNSKGYMSKSNTEKKGIASDIIKELEKDAIEKGFKNSHIVTGKKNHAAIRLYKKLGYFKTDNFEEFREDKTVICMKKNFKK